MKSSEKETPATYMRWKKTKDSDRVERRSVVSLCKQKEFKTKDIKKSILKASRGTNTDSEDLEA